ncbi:hypothetical protein C0J52_17535 [Blattella germanica]|nr:hypothetical protein C0J52_17535 [Blattella germanica]
MDCLKIRPTWMWDHRQQLASLSLGALFWVNHDLIRVAPLIPVLREVKRYLLRTQGEVVILDLHRFPVGFQGRPARHRRLVSLLTRELAALALPSSAVTASTLLRDIWDRKDNRRLIVAYGDKTIAGALWAAMAELTPTPLDVMFNPSGSLRSMADSVNRNLTDWFRNQWWPHTNIVATDFFLGNNLIDVAVSTNLRKINMVES